MPRPLPPLQSWFGCPLPLKGAVQALGLAVLGLPARRQRAEADFRRRCVASLLIFVVVFNQLAESLTCVTAVYKLKAGPMVLAWDVIHAQLLL